MDMLITNAAELMLEVAEINQLKMQTRQSDDGSK